jgi:hypothetical protein
MAKVQNDIVAFVSKYVNEHGRGCPKGVLIHVGGFKAKDILAVLDAGALEAGRGSEGGLFPIGAKPAPKATANVTLKSRMVDFLRTLNDPTAKALCAEYDAEIEKRRDAQKD